eukprot:TRINITY_DN25249_c0_g1_i1.p1 TRINITY_DN25249_c0_g1~~TRINITY_DN25249_c0_g1_i1.p1  ORF type:complete len:322 (+),score=52.16 TRINITY_DN25249_c0_g1_i1:130-966(+)
MQCDAHPSASASSVAGGSEGAAQNMKRLQALLDRFEISIVEAHELAVLQDYEIKVIADDSGSMQSAADPNAPRALGQKAASRWDELRETVSFIVDVASCLLETGSDVHFLNRQDVLGVKRSNDEAFLKAFEAEPRGRTPLTEVIQRLAAGFEGERPTLLFILTDGEPNGGKHPFIRQLTSIVKNAKIRVQIMACTAEEDEIDWLNGLDKDLKEVDVTDDYYSERREVIKAGLAPRFTRGDWCLKAMLGPISHKFDKWDEKLKGKRGMGSADCELCTIS